MGYQFLPQFDGAITTDITKMLDLAKLPNSGQINLWNGQTGKSLMTSDCRNNLYAQTKSFS